MEPSATKYSLARPAVLWLHLLVIAALIVLRRPAAIFHPLFWAEDGQVFYHDAYMLGWPALCHPLGGYLNTFSRIVAAAAVNFPLSWAPKIYAGFAFAVQLIPPALLLSSRLDDALPSHTARLLLAYFYAVQPNSYELNINLTNAQWHLAIAAFLLIAARPAITGTGRLMDLALLLVSGLSGPFGIFLTPIAWAEYLRRRTRFGLVAAAAVSAAGLLQLTFILASHAAAGRLATPLGASLAGLFRILAYRIFLGGLLGDRLMAILLTIPVVQSLLFCLLTVLVCTVLTAAALRSGPVIVRQAVLFATLLFIAALVSPMASLKKAQWAALAAPGNGLRYFIMPSLVWLAALLIMSRSGLSAARIIARTLLVLTMPGIITGFFFPAWQPTGFYGLARSFAAAPTGTAMTFAETPPGWRMTLIKH